MVLAGCFEGCHLLRFGVGVLEGSESSLGEAVEAHVAPCDGPLIVLLGEERADEADDGVAGGEDADDLGAAADLLVQPFLGVVGPDLAPMGFGEPDEGQDLTGGLVEEIEQLAETIRPRYRAFVLTGAYTGLRPGELAALRVDRLDLLRRQLRVEEPLKTAASRRTVTFPAFLADELAAHLATYPGRNRLVFTAPEGGPLRLHLFRRRVWYPAVRDSVGAPMRPHDLRHTHVALLIAEGEDPYVISQRLGALRFGPPTTCTGTCSKAETVRRPTPSRRREDDLSSPRPTRAASAVIGIET